MAMEDPLHHCADAASASHDENLAPTSCPSDAADVCLPCTPPGGLVESARPTADDLETRLCSGDDPERGLCKQWARGKPCEPRTCTFRHISVSYTHLTLPTICRV
eukprot:6297196-Prymnesium_polylepis.1